MMGLVHFFGHCISPMRRHFTAGSREERGLSEYKMSMEASQYVYTARSEARQNRPARRSLAECEHSTSLPLSQSACVWLAQNVRRSLPDLYLKKLLKHAVALRTHISATTAFKDKRIPEVISVASGSVKWADDKRPSTFDDVFHLPFFT